MPNPFPELQPYDVGETPRSPVTAEGWLEREMRAERNGRVREVVDTAVAPEQIARETQVARRAGVPPLQVVDVAAAERGLQVRDFTSLAERYPAMGRFALANPRGAAAAVDDSESLGLLGGAWDFLKNAPGRIGVAGGWRLGQGLTDTWNLLEGGIDTLMTPVDAAIDAVATAGGIDIIDVRATRDAAVVRREANSTYFGDRANAAADRFRGGNTITEGLLSGTESVPVTILAALTRNPETAATAMGALSGASSYADARRQGVAPAQALQYGFTQGLIEGGTERIPVGTLVDMIARKTPFARAFIRELGQEMTGEQAATFLQDMNDMAMLPENRDKTLSDFIAERPQRALDTALAVAGGTTVTTAGIGAAQRASDAVSAITTRVSDARQARTEQQFIDRAERAAEGSKLRQRDPEAFRALLREQAAEAGATSVFIPWPAIRAYQQSDRYNPDSDPFSEYDVDGAEATGGDIVFPIEDAITDLVGTPAWEAIRNDIRLTPGGMSANEADAFETGMDDIMAEASKPADTQGASVRDKLVERVADMFGVSYTSPAARSIAEIAVQRVTTRGERLGQPLTGNEFDNLKVKQIMPEGVAEAVKADNLDVVINAMRAGKDAVVGEGPSLLQFIKERGGVNDTGGDLASIGVPKKLLRDFDPRQTAMGLSGAGDYGLDTTLRAAISAGYFPDLAGMQDESGADQLDVQTLIDALAEEAAGRPVYASMREDPMRVSGADLRAMLESTGYSPDTMTDAEIRAAVEAYATESQGGGYEQADPEGSDAFRAWAGTDAPVIEPDEIDGFDFSGPGPFVMRVFHGTTHEFDAFDASKKGNKEGQFGAVNYFTSSQSDADGNYAGEGPDLTQRIELRAERIEQESDGEIEMAEARAQARAELSGGKQQTLEVYVRTEKPFVVGTDESPWIEFTDFDALETQAVQQVAENEGVEVSDIEANRDDYQDAIDEARWEIEADQPNALFEAVQSVADRYELDAQEIYGQLADTVAVDGTKHNRLEDILRQTEALSYVEDPETGDLISFHVLGEVISALGFDSIIMKNAATRFPNMDIERGTVHVHVFDQHNTNIKSINNRGTFDPADPRILYQAAFHGSPHIFDRFSLDAIGTGEGAQAYGWGLYFAGRKEIAQFYRENVKNMGRIREINARLSELAKVMSADEISYGKYRSDEGRNAKAEYDRLMDERSGVSNADGRLYEVDIPDDDEYLLWDKPLSEQPEKVRVAYLQAAAVADPAWQPDWQTGRKTMTLYNELGMVLAKRDGVSAADNGPRLASTALHDAGIAGIKYLDGGSRADGDGSYNYVVFDENRVSIRAYEQEARGRIIFDQNRNVIELFKDRNLSTALHELSHMWLEELWFDASMPDAPEQLKADRDTVKRYFAANGFAIGDDGMIPVDAHELWARSGERYLMEGKAPSSALTRLFETFRSWLIGIYKTVDRLRAPITPEIREVFDRLLATDEEILLASERQAITALFKDVADLGMSEAEVMAYNAQVQQAKAGAHAALLDKTMRAIRRRETDRYREARKGVRAEQQERIEASPLYRAQAAMKAQRISKEWLADEYGLDVFDLLPVRVPPLYMSGGIDPNIIAELSGYSGARDMIEALMGAERGHRQAKEGGDLRSMRERAIETATDAEMLRRYGDPLTDGSIEREALAAVHNNMQGEVMASELRILSRTTGQRPTPYRIAREWARGKIRGGVVATEASPGAIQRYARNAAKAARAAEAVMLKQDREEAFRQKQAQMVNSALLSEAKEARDDVEAAVNRMDKIARAKTRKSVDQDYLEQAHALLEEVDLRKRSQISQDRAGKWAEWSAAREAEGFDVVVPPSFEAVIGKTNWTRLSVENLLSLDEAIKQIMHLGRLKQTLLDNKEEREFEAVVAEVEGTADGIGRKPPRSSFTDESRWESIKAKVATMDAALLRMEQVFDWLDNGKADGAFNRVVFRPIAEAQERERVMYEDFSAKIAAASDKVPEKTVRSWANRITLDLIDPETGLPVVMERKRLIAMALNWGNAGNRQRLSDGYRWSPDGIERALMDNLSEAEWAFVQDVWDILEELWPEIAKVERAVNGVEPERVEATEVATPFGQLRGGYYPAIYDTRLDYTSEERAAESADLFSANYTRATTRSSASKERAAKVQRPILLDIGVIGRHVGEVIHDVTHRQAVIQANKFLSNRRVMKAVDEVVGPEVRKQFRPWLNHVANSWAQERAGNEGFGRFLGKLRANTTVVGMGFRVTTMITQAAGYSNAAEYVGAKWIAQAVAQVSAHPIASFDFALSRSKELRGRMDTLDRDLRLELKRMTARDVADNAGATLSEVKRFAFHGIGLMDRMVSVPTWIAAYNKAIERGAAEDAAVYEGDKAIRLSQGSGAPKDLASIARGTGQWGQAFKLLTMFYTYVSTVYNRQRTFGRDVSRAKSKDMPALIARAWFLFVVPPLLAEILSGRAPDGDDEDEEWGWWAFKKMLGQSIGAIPIARDAFEPVWDAVAGNNGFDYRFTPIQGAVESIVRVAADGKKMAEGDDTKRATRNILEAAGYFTGLVPGQIAASAQFLVDVGSGDADPEGFAQWYSGLTKGRIED